jgi:ribose transport system permease protein
MSATTQPAAAPPRFRLELASFGPFLALLAIGVLGYVVNPRFIGADNIANFVTRSAFIATIAVGQTLVITAGGLDLSVGSMAALVSGVTILFMNGGYLADPTLTIMAAMALALGLGAVCGLANGLTVTLGGIEPFIVTLGTMGIFRSLTTWLAQGGSIVIKSSELRETYRPLYFGVFLGVPIPVYVIAAVALIGAFILYRTAYGRHVLAVGSNEDVARYSGVNVTRVRTLTYVLQGLCVAIAVIIYIPRLGSTTSTTGLLWELNAITAVVVGGTRLKGGVGRVFGTIAGALILEAVGNIMVLSNFVSEYLIGAVQGAIIVIAMLAQRGLARGR